jgi:hypothetical protein
MPPESYEKNPGVSKIIAWGGGAARIGGLMDWWIFG